MKKAQCRVTKLSLQATSTMRSPPKAAYRKKTLGVLGPAAVALQEEL
jgi:hypothetical protein